MLTILPSHTNVYSEPCTQVACTFRLTGSRVDGMKEGVENEAKNFQISHAFNTCKLHA